MGSSSCLCVVVGTVLESQKSLPKSSAYSRIKAFSSEKRGVLMFMANRFARYYWVSHE